MVWRPPSPDLGPQAQGHIEQRRMGFSPHSGEAERGDLPPQGPSSPLLLLLSPETFPLPMGLAALLTWLVLDLVGVAAIRRKERPRWQSKPSSCPRHCPTAPPFCLLGSSLPGAKSRTQRPSPWCQLPASVFPAAPGSGSYSCPRAYGAALQGSGASSGGPQAPDLKRSSGLPPPARGRSFAAACSSPSVCPLPAPLMVALGLGVLQGPEDRRGALGLAQTPRVPASVGLQQPSLQTVSGLDRTLVACVLAEELWDPDF